MEESAGPVQAARAGAAAEGQDRESDEQGPDRGAHGNPSGPAPSARASFPNIEDPPGAAVAHRWFRREVDRGASLEVMKGG